MVHLKINNRQINLENPQNSVLLKDQFIHIIKKNIDVNIVKYKKLANTIFIIELLDVKEEVLQKDENGYVDLYNIIVTISLKYITPYKNNKIVASASSQLSINEDSTLYDEKKLKAIKIASFKGVDDIMSKLLVQSLINSNEKDIKSK